MDAFTVFLSHSYKATAENLFFFRLFPESVNPQFQG